MSKDLNPIQKARALVADAFLAASRDGALSADEVRAMLSIQNIMDRVHDARVLPGPDFAENTELSKPVARDALLHAAAN